MPTPPPPSDRFRTHPVVWTPRTIGNLWDFYARQPGFDETYFSREVGHWIVRLARRHARLDRVTEILDYSCGKGFLIEALCRRGRPGQRVAGVDISADSCVETERLCRELPGFAGATPLEGFDFDAAAGSRDLVFCLEVVEHMEDADLEATLGRIRRLLRPGGRLLLTTPNRENLAASTTCCPECGCTFHLWQHVRSWTRESLREYMEARGFSTTVCFSSRLTSSRNPLRAWLNHRLLAHTNLVWVGRREG